MQAPHDALGSILTDLLGDEAERAAYRADPQGFLAERGFPDFPDRVVGEAVCHVADTLPAPVAEQLAPEVMALSPLTTTEWADKADTTGFDALDALASMPAHGLADLDADLANDPGIDAEELADVAAIDVGVDPDQFAAEQGETPVDETDARFGTGTGDTPEPSTREVVDDLIDHDAVAAVEEEPLAHEVASVGDEVPDEPGEVTIPIDEPAEPDVDWDDDVG